MTDDDPGGAVARIAEAGRQEVVARLRDALFGEAAAAGLELDDEELDRQAGEAVMLADGVLWRRALAGAAATELGLDLAEAVRHPAVLSAHLEVGAPPFPGDAVTEPAVAETPPVAAEAPPGDTETSPVAAETPPGDTDTPPGDTDTPPGDSAEAEALRVAAVHLGGIEALRAGERDLELRISSAGLDVLKRSSGAPIGRLEWRDIETVELPRGRRGLRPGRRAHELHVATGRGRASFQLPGVTEEQLKRHLKPMLARARASAGRS